MLRVAICDDEGLFRQRIKREVELYFGEHHQEVEISLFSSGEEMDKESALLSSGNIFLLDISMGEMDGITLAEKVRSVNPEAYIVFITSYLKYSPEGYKVGAIRYLLKNETTFSGAFSECMDAIYKDMGKESVKMIFPFREGERSLFLHQIIYVESRLHQLRMKVSGEEAEFYTLSMTLDEFEKKLSGRSEFLRVHKSFLVNLEYAKEIFAYEISLTSGECLPIPKARYKEVKNKYVSYKGEL